MAEVVVVERRRRYHWPEAQLNVWLIITIASAATILGIFSSFLMIQNQLKVGIPWLFPYLITVSSLALLFILIMLILIARRMLLPGIVLLGSFILFVLFLTGLIETSIQLFGPTGSVNGECSIYIQANPQSGSQTAAQGINTLAWLQQNSICAQWKAAFAFLIIGTIFLLWMMIMAWQVNRDEYD